MLVTAADCTTFAATGGSFLLGKANSADAVTSLTRTTGGPALALNTQAGSAPLHVNRQTKVGNLNADFLDGKDSTSLGVNTTAYKKTGTFSASQTFELPTLAPGPYLVTFNMPFQGVGSASPSHPVMGACWALSSGTGADQYTGTQTSVSVLGNPACSGSGQLVVEAGDAVLVTGQLFNATEETWTGTALVPVEVIVTRITGTATGTLNLPAGRQAPRHKPVG